MGNFAGPSDPRSQALIGMGAGMLSQPYTPTPQSGFEPFGRGMATGMDAYQNAIILQQTMAETEAKKKEIQDKAKTKENLIASIENDPSLTPNQKSALIMQIKAGDATGASSMLSKQAFAKPEGLDPSMGDSAMDSAVFEFLSQGGTQEQLQNPQVMESVKRRADQIRTINNPPPASPVKDRFGELSLGVARKDIENITGSAQGARDKLTILNQMNSLSSMIEGGGPAEEIYTAGQALAKQLNVEVGDITQLPPKEAFKALNFRAVQADRAAASSRGAGDPRPSDKDMEIFKAANASLAQSPQGRQLMIELQTLGERQKLQDENTLYALAADFEANGYDPDSALVAASREMKRIQSERAKEQNHLFLTEEEDALSPFGQKVAELSGKSEEELLAIAQGKKKGSEERTEPPRISQTEFDQIPVFQSHEEAMAAGATKWRLPNDPNVYSP